MKKWIMVLFLVVSFGSGLLGESASYSKPIKTLEHGIGY